MEWGVSRHYDDDDDDDVKWVIVMVTVNEHVFTRRMKMYILVSVMEQ